MCEWVSNVFGFALRVGPNIGETGRSMCWGLRISCMNYQGIWISPRNSEFLHICDTLLGVISTTIAGTSVLLSYGSHGKKTLLSPSFRSTRRNNQAYHLIAFPHVKHKKRRSKPRDGGQIASEKEKHPRWSAVHDITRGNFGRKQP